MEPRRAKIFYLKKRVLFPYCTLPVSLRPSDQSNAIHEGDSILAFSITSIFDIIFHQGKMATLAEVTEIERSDQKVTMKLRGLARAVVQKIVKFTNAEYLLFEAPRDDLHHTTIDELRKKCQEVIFLINVPESDKLIQLLNYIVDPDQMSDFIANYFVIDFKTRYRLYRETDPVRRSRMLINELSKMIQKMTANNKRA